MTPRDKHTEVVWQAKQRSAKAGSEEAAVHKDAAAMYTAPAAQSVINHSESPVITEKRITREQQLQNLRLAAQEYMQPEIPVKHQYDFPEKTFQAEQPIVKPEAPWHREESYFVPDQTVYSNAGETKKRAQTYVSVSEEHKITGKQEEQLAREKQLQNIRLATQKYVQVESGRAYQNKIRQENQPGLQRTVYEPEDKTDDTAENIIRKSPEKKAAAVEMRSSMSMPEANEIPENHDFKEQKLRSMRLAMWRYLQPKTADTQDVERKAAQKDNSPDDVEQTGFQREDETSSTLDGDKRKYFSRNYVMERMHSSTAQDSMADELSARQNEISRLQLVVNKPSLQNKAKTEEPEEEESDSPDDFNKAKSLIYLAKIKRNRKRQNPPEESPDEDISKGEEFPKEETTLEEEKELPEEETARKKNPTAGKEQKEKTDDKRSMEKEEKPEIQPSQAAAEWNREMDRTDGEDPDDDFKESEKRRKKTSKKKNTEKPEENEKVSDDRKRKKDKGDIEKKGKIRTSIKWFRRTKNFQTTVQSFRLSGNEEEAKKRADYQQRMLLRHGVVNTAKISAGIIKIIASNIVLLLPIILIFLLLGVLFLGVKSERQSASSAYDGACYLAAKYESGGNPDQVGGDAGNACGEFQFDNRYELGPFVRWCYEKDPTTYGPFEPYLGMTTELKNNAGFYGAWHSICVEHKIAFEAAQCEYVYTQTLQPLLASLTEHYGFDFTNASDALKGCVLSFGNRDGKYVVSLKRYFDGTTAASTDREIIERAYNAMIARRPNVSRWSYEKADCLAQLDGTLDIYAPSENGAGGIDWSWKKSTGAGESGNAAVQAALNAVGSGYSQSRRDDPGWYDCSSLVYRSYAAAGITYLNGMDAASEAECLVNKGMTVSYSELQPGDLIFYSYTANGKYRNISHVAIYLGNGEMVHAADESRGVCKQAMSQSNLSPQLYCRPQ